VKADAHAEVKDTALYTVTLRHTKPHTVHTPSDQDHAHRSASQHQNLSPASAGYGHRLWGWDDPDTPEVACLRSSIAKGENGGKIGWARVNFNYFIGEEEADYVRHAVLQIAEHGWRLLPFYTMDPCSGQFAHRTFKRLNLLRSLAELDLQPGSCTFRVPCQDTSPMNHADELRRAEAIYQIASGIVKEKPKGVMCRKHDYSKRASVELLDFEWWLTPSKAVELMQQEDAAVAEKKFGAMGALYPGEDEQLRNMIESTGVFKTFDDLEPTSSRQSTN